MGSIQTPIPVRSSGLLENSCGYLLQELQMIWDEVGEDEFEREKVLLDIEQECLGVYRKKVDYANMARSRLHQELAESESEFTQLLLSLGERSLPERPEKKAGTLRQQIDSITPALSEMRQRKRERMNQFQAVQGQIQKIKAEISGLSEYDDSASIMKVNENDLSLKRLEEYQAELKKLQNEKSTRLQKVERYTNQIHDLAALLGTDSSMTITKIHPSLNELCGIAKNISDNILAKLEDTVKSLEEEKQKRIEELHHLGEALLDMWKLIDTPEKERQPFFHVVNLLVVPFEKITKPGTLTTSIIQQAETEVKRLDELKASKMKELFHRKQFELQEICSRSHMEIPSPSEMENITHLVDSGTIDLVHLLKSMDEQIAKAQEEASSRKAIMERVDKWILARDEERWLEEYNRDENRYSVSRGAHKNLKRAERARVTVIKIPALIDMLISLTREWEAERNKVFLYDEAPLLAMLEEYIALRQEKEEEKQRLRLEKKKVENVHNNLSLSPRPGTSARRIPNKNLNGSFSNGSPTKRNLNGSPLNRRLSLGAQQAGSNSFNPRSLGTSFMQEGIKPPRQQMYAQSEYVSHLRDETASVVSTFSGPLSPEI
ncbi:65-kDa microtubule-associated protein 8-like [Chenopodium quinoa]|uniref:65-kDa microtubule-associated protein 8-like n=1 Tax=Chenopodium quinoa TaxID=63459 RepID=UPI000B793D9F|nr:65-kDa microtubule-associated protein 8-like [Chenopodium quinoa]